MQDYQIQFLGITILNSVYLLIRLSVDIAQLECKTVVVNAKCPTYPRIGHQCIFVGQDLLVFGGTNYYADFVSIVLKINCLNLRCQSVVTQNALPLQGFSLFSFENRIFLWGGLRPTNASNQLWEFDGSRFVGLRQSGSVPSPRCYHASSMCLGKYLIVFGGFDRSVFYNDWHILDCQQWVWKQVTPSMSINLSYGSKLLWVGGRGILCEGSSFKINDKTPCYSNKLYECLIKDFKNPKIILKQIEVNNSEQPPSRSSPSFICLNDRQIYLMGGQRFETGNQMFYDDVWVFSLETLKWKQINVNIQIKYGFQLCAFKDKLYSIGGVKHLTQFSNEIQVFDLFHGKYKSKLCSTCSSTFTSMTNQFQNNILTMNLKQIDLCNKITVPLIGRISQYLNPINAIGLLVDNSFNMSSTSISINHLTVKGHLNPETCIQYFDNSTSFAVQDIQQCINRMTSKVGIISHDYKIDEQYAIQMEYGINLKFAALRLGQSFFYLTKTISNQIFGAYFSKTLLYNNSSNLPTYVYSYNIDQKGKCNSNSERQHIVSLIGSRIPFQQMQNFNNFKTKIYIFGVRDFDCNFQIKSNQQTNQLNLNTDLITFLKKQYLVPYIGRSIKVNSIQINYENIAQQLRERELLGKVKQIQIKCQQRHLKKIGIYELTHCNEQSQIFVYHQNRFIMTIKVSNVNIYGFIQIPDAVQINIFKQKIANNRDMQKLTDFIKKIESYIKSNENRKLESNQSMEEYCSQKKYAKLNHY